MLKDSGNIHDSYILENAGLILLCPFLPALFQQLNLIENNIFNSKADAIHAVNLLEYLVNGHKKTHNDNLWLNNLLCNIPYDYPVECADIITKKEVDECDALLKSVISQWTALKNVNIDGLREAFLKRKGELQFEDKVVLRIETHAIDVLLDSLPWNFSLIRLPWMDICLNVNWR